MIYAQIKNDTVLKYPLSEKDIKAMFPNTSFLTDFVPPDGFVTVKNSAPPQASYDKNVVEVDPIFINGEWFQSWVVENATQDEIFARSQQKEAQVRKQRQEMLFACDWTQLADAPVDKAIWANYRQALRDVTTQQGFPWSVVWPVEPSK